MTPWVAVGPFWRWQNEPWLWDPQNLIVGEDLPHNPSGGLTRNPNPIAQRKVQRVVLVIESGCQLRCSYCAAGSFMKSPTKAARLDLIFEAIQQAQELGWLVTPFDLSFTGGEPLVVLDTIHELTQKFLVNAWIRSVHITTNGVLLPHLAQHPFWSSIPVHLTLSWEGHLVTQSERRPFKDSQGYADWAQVLKTVVDLKPRLASLTAHSVYDGRFYDWVETYDFLSSQGMEYFDWTWNYYDNNLTAIDRLWESIQQKADNLLKKEGIPALWGWLPLRRVWQLYANGQILSHHCGGGWNTFILDGQGLWYNCPWQAGYRGSPSSGQRSVAQVPTLPMWQLEECHKCPALPFCGGGCHWAISNGFSKSFCHFQRWLVGLSLKILAQEAQKKDLKFLSELVS